MTRRILALLPWFALCTPLMADTIQPLSHIEQVVGDFVRASHAGGDDVEFTIGRLDPRLRLPLCAQALDTRYTHARRNSGPSSVEVRCEGDKPWALYVPVTLVRYADVVVTRRALARGETVRAEDTLVERRRIEAGRADYFEDVSALSGLVALRPIDSGQILTRKHLKKAQIVRRGDSVLLSSSRHAIQVQVKGEALEDGAAGERINVLNLRSERVIEGVVTPDGRVVVHGDRVL